MDSAEFNEQYITPKQLEEIFGISRGYQYKLRMRKNYTDIKVNKDMVVIDLYNRD